MHLFTKIVKTSHCPSEDDSGTLCMSCDENTASAMAHSRTPENTLYLFQVAVPQIGPCPDGNVLLIFCNLLKRGVAGKSTIVFP